MIEAPFNFYNTIQQFIGSHSTINTPNGVIVITKALNSQKLFAQANIHRQIKLLINFGTFFSPQKELKTPEFRRISPQQKKRLFFSTILKIRKLKNNLHFNKSTFANQAFIPIVNNCNNVCSGC